jgi:aminopeptidase N
MGLLAMLDTVGSGRCSRFMRWWLVAGAASLGWIAQIGPARAIDAFFPTFGNRGIDVRHYAVKLDVDAKSHCIDGQAVLEITATEKLDSFSLDLSRLQVSRVKIDGVDARWRQEPGKLVIAPAKAIAKGKRFALQVAYGGFPKPIPDPTVDGPDLPGLGWTDWRDTSYVVSEPVGAGTWYPVNDEPTDKAGYRFTITVAKPYVAIANGVPLSVTDLGSKRRFVWEQAQPMAGYLAITDIDRYTLDQRHSASGVPIRSFLAKGTPDSTVAALRQTPAMLDFIERVIGPYPFDGYGAVTVDDPALYYALETQALSTFSSTDVNDLTVVHELAHQWFGDAVTVKRWRDLWLAEGFATYFEYLWAYRGNRPELDLQLADLHRYAVDNSVGPAVVSRPQDLFADITYVRGALALHALRLEVGDDRFFKILRAYYRTYRYGNATSADFVDVAAGVGGAKVRPLLHAWLYEAPVPAFLPGAALTAQARKSAPTPMPQLAIGVRRRQAG